MVRSDQDGLRARVAAIVRRHRDGDADAMGELFRVVRPWLVGVARACGLSAHSADDVVQSTMMTALAHLPRLRDPEAALAWLSVIARREAVRVSREERRTDPLDDDVPLVVDPADPEGIVLARIACAGLYRAMGCLSERERMLLVFLFFDGGRDYASVAREMRVPIGSIGPTRQRGLRKIRGMMESEQDGGLARSA